MQLVNELKPLGGSLLCARLQTSAQLPRKPYPSSRHILPRKSQFLTKPYLHLIPHSFKTILFSLRKRSVVTKFADV